MIRIQNYWTDFTLCIVPAIIGLLHAAAFAGNQTVVLSSGANGGSLPYAVDHAVNGDTIIFSIPGTDTVTIPMAIGVSSAIVIQGRNRETGNRCVVKVDSPGVSRYRIFTITGGPLSIRNLVLQGGSVFSGSVVSVSGAGTTVLFDSVMIEKGVTIRRSSSENGYITGGGGLFVDSAAVVHVMNSTIRDNSCLTCTYSRSKGGGVFNRGGIAAFGNCTIQGNSSYSDYSNSWGGGICNEGGTLNVFNCTIDSNTSKSTVAHSLGGAIYNSGDMTISHCALCNNIASYSSSNESGADVHGGGIFNTRNAVIEYCSIRNNVSSTSIANHTGTAFGGGVDNSGGIVLITFSTIGANRSVSGSGGTYGTDRSYGGGMNNSGGLLIVRNCIVDSNFTDSRRVTFGGGISSLYGLTEIENSTICRNSVYSSLDRSGGAGVYASNKSLTLLFSTVCNNVGLSSPTLLSHSLGGGVYSDSSQCHFLNSLVINNTTVSREGVEQNSDHYFTHFRDSANAVNSIFGSGIFALSFTSCDTGMPVSQVFGASLPVPASNGGPTQTVALPPLSLANGRGIRCGTYIADTIFLSMVPRAAYYTASGWCDLESGQLLQQGTSLSEITGDQRGSTRSDPPGIGAYDGGFPAALGIPAHRVLSCQPADILNAYSNRLSLRCQTQGVYRLTIFTLMGQGVDDRYLFLRPGQQTISLPISPAPGFYVAAINGIPKLIKWKKNQSR